jgi:Tol biopolymer transport system component
MSIQRHTKKLAVAAALALACVVATVASAGPAPATTRVSVSSGGAQGEYESYAVAISAGGRYVAFTSLAPNLVPGDTNERRDAFVRDRRTGATTRISVSDRGEQAQAVADDPWGGSGVDGMSADGRYVVFESDAPNLVRGDTNRAVDVFVRDTRLKRTTRVSVSSGGGQGNGQSSWAAISGDGRYVAFVSDATNLVAGDTNHGADVFLRDRRRGTTVRVSVGPHGRQTNRGSESSTPALGRHGRFVAFTSNATNLVAGDHNKLADVFVRDLVTHRTTRVSVTSRGKEGGRDRTGNGSNAPSLSANGRFVAFHSAASNLVPGDTNGVFDIFVHDRATGTTRRVSVGRRGRQANAESLGPPSISRDGRFIAFASLASNLVAHDENDITDAFIYDLKTGRTVLGSLGKGGIQGNDGSTPAATAFSADDRYLALSSWASNLVPHDTNGNADAFVRVLPRRH